MKKIVFMAAMLLSMTTATFAANEENEAAASAYSLTFNSSALSDALALTLDQEDAMNDVHKSFSTEMANAAQANGSERTDLVNKAVLKNLKYMRSILNANQYKKYVMLLNTTLYNRGILK